MYASALDAVMNGLREQTKNQDNARSVSSTTGTKSNLRRFKMVGLGDKVRDTVSGFKGIITGKHDYLQGCSRMTVQPEVDKDGKLPEAQSFDEPQLELITPRKELQGKKNTGGPMPYIDNGRYIAKEKK